MRQKFYDTAVKQEKAVLVGVMTPNETEEQEKEYLEELEFLVATAGGETMKSFTELTPSQLRNIENELQVKILDRNNLILDIFCSSRVS